MLAAKTKRKIRESSKQHKPLPRHTDSCINNKNMLKRLSLSFYGEDTIKKSKQIILDNCDIEA